MLCVACVAFRPALRHHALRRDTPRSAAPVLGEQRGHVFVAQGDVRQVMADAVLFPTRTVADTAWFPKGPPAGARAKKRKAFTFEQRVHRVRGLPSSEPSIYLGWLYWEGQEEPPLGWFVDAAEQFLHAAHRHVQKRGDALCGRELPLLALPVVGTGSAGGQPVSGALLAELLRLLGAFTALHAVDVALMTKSRVMFSAAQSARLQLERAEPMCAASRAPPRRGRQICPLLPPSPPSPSLPLAPFSPRDGPVTAAGTHPRGRRSPSASGGNRPASPPSPRPGSSCSSSARAPAGDEGPRASPCLLHTSPWSPHCLPMPPRPLLPAGRWACSAGRGCHPAYPAYPATLLPCCRTMGLPGWSELLSEVGVAAGLGEEELRQASMPLLPCVPCLPCYPATRLGGEELRQSSRARTPPHRPRCLLRISRHDC